MKTAHATNSSLADVAGQRAKHYVDTSVDAYNSLSKKTQAVGKRVDGYVRTNPWMMIGAAAGAGLLVGLMLRRR
jgi:ElaB/YqjD/DUF883 family membrane-anchored ribosome-binding protein